MEGEGTANWSLRATHCGNETSAAAGGRVEAEAEVRRENGGGAKPLAACIHAPKAHHIINTHGPHTRRSRAHARTSALGSTHFHAAEWGREEEAGAQNRNSEVGS